MSRTLFTRASFPVKPEEWMAEGLCTQVSMDMWYPQSNGETIAPKRICRGCPVRERCLAYALEHDELHGVWGGCDTRERQRMVNRSVA